MSLTTWVHTLRDGLNTPRDIGKKRKPFMLTAKSAAKMISNFEAHGSPLPVDIAHSMWKHIEGLSLAERYTRYGKMLSMEYRPGKGLYTLNHFTEDGTSFIKKSEGAYFSAVVEFDPITDEPVAIHGAALTPRPAINLEEIQAFSSVSENTENLSTVESVRLSGDETSSTIELSQETAGNQPTEKPVTAGSPPAGEKHMSNLAKIAVLLKAEGETDPEKLAEKALGLLEVFASVRDSVALAAGLDPKVATLSQIGDKVKERFAATVADPEKFVAISAFTELKTAKEALDTQIKELQSKVEAFEADEIVRPFMAGREVKITPALKPTALAVLKAQGKEGLEKFVAALPTQVVTGGGVSEGGVAEDPTKKKTTEAHRIAALAAEFEPTTVKLIEQPSQGK